MKLRYQVDYQGRDQIQVFEDDTGTLRLQANGCTQLRDTLKDYLQKFGPELKSWKLSEPKNHAEFLIRKLIFTIDGRLHPYLHEEICHCRIVPTQKVEDAIFNGAKDIESLRRITTASTSCGTCAPDIENILKFWNQ